MLSNKGNSWLSEEEFEALIATRLKNKVLNSNVRGGFCCRTDMNAGARYTLNSHRSLTLILPSPNPDNSQLTPSLTVTDMNAGAR